MPEPPDLSHVFVPTTRTRFEPRDEESNLIRKTFSCEDESKSGETEVQEQSQRLTASPPTRPSFPKTDFLRHVEAGQRRNWRKPTAVTAAKSPAKPPRSPSALVSASPTISSRTLNLNLRSPTEATSDSTTSEGHATSPTDPTIDFRSSVASIVTLDPTIEALLQNIRSRSPSVPKTPTSISGSPFPPSSTIQSPQSSIIDSEVARMAQTRLRQNQEARERFLFGKQTIHINNDEGK